MCSMPGTSALRHALRIRGPQRQALTQVPKSNEKVAEIDEHIGCAMSGLTADARTLIDHARNETQVPNGSLGTVQHPCA